MEGIYTRIWIFALLQLVFATIVHLRPKYYGYIIPIFITFCMEFVVNLSIANENYPVSEWALPCITFCNMLVVIAPGQAKSICISFTLGWVYYLYQLYFVRDMLQMSFFVSFLLSIGYFVVSSVVVNYNIKNLYHNMAQNRNQTHEMRRLLEVFPHGVIIQSDMLIGSKIEFTNQEFKQQVKNVQNNVKLLQTVKVDFVSGEGI